MENRASDQSSLLALAARVLLPNYRPQPVVMTRGEGVYLWDLEGKRYLDMTAGIAVCSLGYGHPQLTQALTDQARRLLHVSNLFHLEQQIRAAQAITERCFAQRVFFCNSGAEANEAAIKLARRYQHVICGRPERNKIIATENSFHGRTVAALSITGQEKYRTGFGPLFGPVDFIPFGQLDAAEAALAASDACALIVEPIQGEGGLVVPPANYLAGLRELCDHTETLLIFDEVQTGMGRTGRWFGHQHENMSPDVMTMAKALGGGVPVGALAASEKAAEGLAFREGGAVPHATTFGGNALVCAAVCCVIEVIESEGLLENCVQVGQYLGQRLQEMVERYPKLCLQARGRGLLRGLALATAAGPICIECRERGLLVSAAGGSVLRLVPPLTIHTSHVDEALTILEPVLAKYANL